MSDLFDDGRLWVGVFGLGLAAAGGAVLGSKSEVSEYRRAYSRWSDEFWSEVVEGPAAQVSSALRGAYLVLTAKWIGDGTLEDPSVSKIWLRTLPSDSAVSFDEMAELWTVVSGANAGRRKLYANKGSVKEILASRTASSSVSGAVVVEFPEWRFLPGEISMTPDGRLVVANRHEFGPVPYYVVSFYGGDVSVMSALERPASRRGVCPPSFAEKASETGAVFGFTCDSGIQAASFVTSRRVLVVR